MLAGLGPGPNPANVKFQKFSVFRTENLISYFLNINGKKTELFLILITIKYQKQPVLKPFIFYIDTCQRT